MLAQVNAEPAASITLTIDSDLQEQAQAAMDGLPGAIVVMEVKTGRVLAMVSSPGFDPNWYDLNNVNRVYTDEQPTFNRATQGTYPLGSVFKIVTMAAALESGVFTPQSTWDCQYSFTELVPSGGPPLYDWTWEYCNDQKLATGKDICPSWPPSGLLTLPAGLDALLRPVVLPHRLYPLQRWQGHVPFPIWPGPSGWEVPPVSSRWLNPMGTSRTPPTAPMPPASPSARVTCR